MKKNRQSKLLRQRKNVLVRNGVDIQKQVVSTGNGDFFTGNAKAYETSYVNPSCRSMWNISFRDRKSGNLFRCSFCGQMRIGRNLPAQTGEVCLVLAGDARVSQNHCLIYEAGGKLFLKDQYSKNHTYVNGRQIGSPVCIKCGDRIRIGDTILEIEFGRQGKGE